MTKQIPMALALVGLIASLAPAPTIAQAFGQAPIGPDQGPGFAAPPWAPGPAYRVPGPFTNQAMPPAPWSRGGPTHGRPWSGAHRSGSGLRIRREATPDTYLIRIELGDARPEAVQTGVFGRWLGIRYRSDAETVRDERLEDGRAYRQSYSVSRSVMTRRLPLPPDADLSRLTREVRDGTLVLRVPRMGPPGFGH